MAVQGRRPGDEHADRLNEYYEDTWFDDRFLWLDPRNRALHFGYEQPGETLIGIFGSARSCGGGSTRM